MLFVETPGRCVITLHSARFKPPPLSMMVTLQLLTCDVGSYSLHNLLALSGVSWGWSCVSPGTQDSGHMFLLLQ